MAPESARAAVRTAQLAPSRRRGRSASAGTGGAIARAASVGRHSSKELRPLAAARRSAALAAASQAAAHHPSFTLLPVPVADPAPSGGGAPDISPFSLAPFGTSGTDILATWLLIGGGALLIALMVLDAAGVGPRHGHLRRRGGQWRLPWR